MDTSTSTSTSSLHARAVQLPAALIIAASSTFAVAQTVQEDVHRHSHEVMPFDLTKTVHVFRMTDDGGTQRVVFRGDSPQPEQVRKIQHHLAMEAAAFQKGNFGDPVHLHGPNMPGLRELQAGAPRIQITYRALSNGAEIQFRTQDIELITAVHRWFGAQLSEHGPDARAE